VLEGRLGSGRQHLARRLLAGALFGLEFFFIAEGLQLTTAAHMSVFLYTAPIFTALGVHFLLASERLRPLQWLGILLAFVGIAIAFAGGVSWDNLDRRMLLGDALGVLPAPAGARPPWWCAPRVCQRRR
jgi:drug/metabolite transporter (DMT)-like permease